MTITSETLSGIDTSIRRVQIILAVSRQVDRTKI